ncbi:MAG TPA: hypothetical protein VHF23_05600 [Gaiellaceae bacterium]|nr:hypothetical protein [Gaiellaceae bacterium]
MGKILLYLGAGYVALVLISSALFTGPGGLPLLVLAAIVFALYRAGALDRLRPQANERVRLAPASAAPAPAEDALHADALRYVRRFEGAEGRLAAALPEDPLESPALVAVLASYLHEPPAARMGVEREYREQRDRFLAWRRSARLLASPHLLDESGLRGWLAAAEELGAELSEVERYVAEIEDRAEAAEGLADEALERATRAGELLGAARASAAAVPDEESARALNERLDVAEAKHGDAWKALEKGKERPVTALRLAEEAAALADEVARQAARIAGLPAEIERRLSELQSSLAQVEAELERVHEEFEAASSSYAPSCWHEIGGVGHAARRATDRARRLLASAARLAGSADADELGRAERELEDARLALADASRLRGAIERHLAKLETAAVEGRDRVVRAEQEIDRAWSAARRREDASGDEELLRRATDLVEQAREGLAKPQPDWLTIVELADRAGALARETDSGTSTAGASESPQLTLERVKARAKEARDSAWAHVIVRPAAAEAAPALLEAAEEAYQSALRAERSAGGASEGERLASALAAFEEAERAASAFCREVEGVDDALAARFQEGEVRVAHTLVWDLKLTRTGRP